MSQGRKSEPERQLFLVAAEVYAHIPRDHFYERLNAVLDLEFVRKLTLPLYQDGGRPSLDPVVFFQAMLVGFFENVVYDTELEYRIADSLTLRKFLGYSLEERTPDESTLRKTRQRMPEEVFDQVFRKVLDQCQAAGLLKGRAVGTDSTQIDANASMDSLKHKTLGCTYEEYVLALRRQDQPEATREDAKTADKKRGNGKASNQEWESATDPEARVMQHADGHTHLSYRVDTTVDLETGVIVVAGAELANVSDQTDFLERVDEAGFAPTQPTSSSWRPVGCPFHVPYEAPQGRRVNAMGAHFTHGPRAGELAFVSYASLPKSQAQQPPPVAEQAAKHGLTEDEVGKIDSEVLLAFLWTVAGRPAVSKEGWRRERPLWHVLDNYSVHKSDRVRVEEAALAAAGIHLFYLPAYSPELSRMEPVWQDVKYQGLPVRSFDRLGALKGAVDTALARKAIELRTTRRETAQLLT